MRIKILLLCSFILLFGTLLSCTEALPEDEISGLMDITMGINEIHDGYNKLLEEESILMSILYTVDSKNINNSLGQYTTSYSQIHLSGNNNNLQYKQSIISCDDLTESDSPEIIEYVYDGINCQNIVNGEVVATLDSHLTKEKLLQFSACEWEREDIKEIYKVISGDYCHYTLTLSTEHFDKHTHSEGEGESGVPQELLARTYTVTINLETGMIEHTSQHDIVNTTMFGETEQYNRYTDCTYQLLDTNTN